MRLTMLVSLLAVALVAPAVVAHGQGAPSGKPITVTGTLIDTKCYSLNHANTGLDHQSASGKVPGCATACARMGEPVAVLTPKGQVYVLVAPSVNLADYMARDVRVTGARVYGNAIRPEKFEVKGADGSWSAVSVAGMM